MLFFTIKTGGNLAVLSYFKTKGKGDNGTNMRHIENTKYPTAYGHYFTHFVNENKFYFYKVNLNRASGKPFYPLFCRFSFVYVGVRQDR